MQIALQPFKDGMAAWGRDTALCVKNAIKNYCSGNMVSDAQRHELPPCRDPWCGHC